MNKLRAFLLRKRVRYVIGQAEPALDFDQVLADGKILFVSLSKGRLGEEAAALLGSLVMAQLWQATMRRAALPPSKRRPVFAYVDEFQDYLHLPTSAADMLAQARGLGLSLTLAHQHLGQLPTSLRQAVLANARTKVIFATTADDARTLAREFAPYLSADDLKGLGQHEVATAISVGGRVMPPATGVTSPPPPITGSGMDARAWSRDHYGQDRTEIEAAIRARQHGPQDTGSIGTRRRSS